MTDPQKLAPLVQISRLILEGRLAAVEQAARACADSRARLADLAKPAAETDLPLAAAALAALRYERWAEARRAEINLCLARQTAEWLAARDAARTAFGRAEALRALEGRAREARNAR